MTMKNLYIGLMSGTSLDGIDSALVEINTEHVRLLHTYYHEYDDHTRVLLKVLSSGEACLPSRIGQADAMLGKMFAECVMTLLNQHHISPEAISAIGSHGQTIAHAPGNEHGFTMQIGDPNRIAAITGIRTVADFRRMDIAHCGQGAPLVPLFHQYAFGKKGRRQAVVNIGGISNVSLLPGENGKPLQGFDTGPGNILMNEWIHKHYGKAYDHNGSWASTGKTHSGLLKHLLEDPFFTYPPPKSTGTDYFSLSWIEKKLETQTLTLTTEDIQATLCALTAESIHQAIQTHLPDPDQILLCGGGAKNGALIWEIKNRFSCDIDTTDNQGIPGDWVEACAFAWLADQRIRMIPVDTPQITGARAPSLLGAIYQSRH